LLETVLAMLAPTYVEQNTRMEITAVRQYVKSKYDFQQWKCIDELWQRESSWRTRNKPWRARNPSSGAYGIPQEWFLMGLISQRILIPKLIGEWIT
jgi:hypothetical protein